MASQKYTTLGQGSLASAYTAGDTSLVLGSGQGATLPSSGDFVVGIGNPVAFLLKATARSTDTLTVEAAAVDGTTAVNKPIGTAVTEVITATVLDGIRSDMSGIGTRANLPATSEAHNGDRYRCTDSPYEFVYNGSVWVPFAYGHKCTEPLFADFAWINQGGATVTTTEGGLRLLAPSGSGDNHRILKRSAPSTPYTITAMIKLGPFHTQFQQAWIGWRQSSDGKLACNLFFIDGVLCKSTSNKASSPTVFVADYITPIANINPTNPLWLRITDDGTNRKTFISFDGTLFQQVHSVSRTDFLTGNEVGFGVNSVNATYDTSAWLLSWEAS